MADPVDSGPAIVGGSDDDILTAFLDGELDAAGRAALEARLAAEPLLAERLAALRAGDRGFAVAYDALLAAAPVERLQAMLAGVVARQPVVVSVSRRRGMPRGWLAAAAAAVIFAAGAMAGYLLPMLRPAEPPGWRAVVAEYFVLVTPETLEVIRSDPATMSAELGVIGEKLALPLSPDALALGDAELKRAQLYEFRGRPLVQLSYLVGSAEPMALCIIANGRPDAEIAFEERQGSNVVFWTKDGLGYMLIGKAPRVALEAYAGDLSARLSPAGAAT